MLGNFHCFRVDISMDSSILYSNLNSTIVLIDIPRSIELVQGFPSFQSPRLLSTSPFEHPLPSLEPKSSKAKRNLHLEDASLDDLLTRKVLSLSLEELKEQYNGPWCLPRVTENPTKDSSARGTKRKRTKEASNAQDLSYENSNNLVTTAVTEIDNAAGVLIHQNQHHECTAAANARGEKVHLPPKSTALCQTINIPAVLSFSSAPKFNIITLDPPWPNRSARRKDSYSICYNTSEIRNLLQSLPFRHILADEGLIAIWITNKSVFREMVVSDGGLFHHWGVTLIEEWIWLKTTTSGVPISAIDGVWRKPYEILLIGQRSLETRDVKKRVIVGVPDLHSRKPNLKELMERVFDLEKGKSVGLEVFARNLTEGWWAWGNECLKFQGAEYWSTPTMEEEAGEEAQH